MLIIVTNFDATAYDKFCDETIDVREKRRLFDAHLIEEEVDSVQREILGDLLFLAVHFCAERKHPFAVAETLLELIEEDLHAMLRGSFDDTAPNEQRIQRALARTLAAMRDRKRETDTEKEKEKEIEKSTAALSAEEWKSVVDFLSTHVYRDLDALNFALNNVPTVVEKTLDLFVDTPVSKLQQLPQS